MSIEELESSYSGGRPGLDRTPPQDVAAEMSVLGGMLLSKDAIADVIEQIRGNDFYRPAHEAIYDAIIDLYGRGEPADAITVLAELQRRGEHARIGGAPYLHDLMAGVPTAANAGYYARIVRERAIMRRLVEAGTRIVQMGYATDGGEVDDVVNNAQAEVYAVTERRASEDYLPLADIIGPTFDEIDAAQGRGEGLTGVPTGYSDFDRLTNGLHGGQMIVVAARPAVGKALALDTPLPTPSGWTTMGEVAVGDLLLAADGTPTRVVAATEVMQRRPCYEVEFDDGTVIVADAQHQWAVGAADDAQILTTEEIAGKLGGGTDLSIGPGHDGAPHVFGFTSVRAIESVPVRCVEVEHESHLYLASRSMIPTHNSVLGINVASHAAIHHNLASVIFSLEMSRNEIVMRMLAAEARVPLTKMRSGNMDDGDWQKLAATMGKVSDAPLFIDDSPNMSLMEIRAKCRRLKQKHDLKLVVIDYLQLMSSGKRVESRQQEVSEFSRSLKLLAKELEVPVIAISQLNRGAEQRSDKKPQMSDLRESGCLTASTRILRADTGAETTMGELHSLNAKEVPVWALNERLQYVRRHLTHVFPTGVKPVFRMRLASGKEIEATSNHPFLSYNGWTPLEDLEVGSRIGVPRHVPGPELNTEWDDRKVVMLAHLLGDGSFVKRQPIRYASVDERNLTAVTDAAGAFGITPVRDDYAAARVTTLRLRAPSRLARGTRNPIAEWLDDMGLFGARSHEKFVPTTVFHLPKRQIALFIKHIWATDGSVTINKNGRSGRIYYASTSRELVEGISRLLLRFGISTRLRHATAKGTYRKGYTLDISGVDDQRRFLQEIGVHGDRGDVAERLLDIIRETKANTNVDTIPKQVWEEVRDLLTDKKISHRKFAAAMGTQFSGSGMWKTSPSRGRLARVAAVLESEELEIMAVNDLLWDEVVAIEPLGEQQVYDATVLDTHNFIANGIAVHNSIEQDADVVILLHREDAYEKESPRAGEADFIVAKHRNGPTDVITVAFQGHYQRFVDMQV